MRNWAALVRLVSTAGIVVATVAPLASAQTAKMGPLAARAAARTAGTSRVIVGGVDPATLSQVRTAIQQRGGTVGRALPIINAVAATLPNAAIDALSEHTAVRKVWLDRVTFGSMERTGATVGAAAVRLDLGVDGTGIGVAVIDSGITSRHDDLTDSSGAQRVSAFADFVNGRSSAYDDYGHGTHVAGIIAGNGTDSGGARTGIAPGASLIGIKVLGADGTGRISDVIAGLDFALANKDSLRIRVVNLSLSAGVFESYNTDPLTVAAKRLVDAGVVVVAAAGNAGRTTTGVTQYGAITAPGNAPWVLTVGATTHAGTVDPFDDKMAGFSSRGPTAVDYSAKPDIVAPGVGTESLSDPDSAFYVSRANYLLSGTVVTSYLPYLSLSGTSMAAPVVAGTVALMLQANPTLTPNQVKALLEYTAHVHPHYNRLTQGAGFLNAKGAVELARHWAAPATTSDPVRDEWSDAVVWGNRLLHMDGLDPAAPMWAANVRWGASAAADGTPIDIRSATRNIVWGNTCAGADCQTAWTIADGGTAMTTTSDDAIVVWGGTADDQIVVWGGTDDAIVVWGGSVVTSSSDDEIVVWGGTCTTCEPMLWAH